MAGLGTGGTLMGNGRRLKEDTRRRRQDRRRRADAGRAGAGTAVARRRLHPADHRHLAARPEDLRHQPRCDYLDPEALRGRGLFAGVSSGAIASIAVRIAGELDEGNVVFVVCDDGWNISRRASARCPSTRSRTWTPPFGGSDSAAPQGRICPPAHAIGGFMELERFALDPISRRRFFRASGVATAGGSGPSSPHVGAARGRPRTRRPPPPTSPCSTARSTSRTPRSRPTRPARRC